MSPVGSSRARGPLSRVRRFTTLSVAVIGVAAVAVRHQQAAPVLLAQFPSSSQARTYAWTPEIAARFPGCEARVPAGTMPSAFIVERLDGSFQRMAFDEAWRRTHDAQRADDVWVYGACR